MPNLKKNALLEVKHRAIIFMKKITTVVLVASVILWWLANYPAIDRADMSAAAQAQIQTLETQSAAQSDG